MQSSRWDSLWGDRRTLWLLLTTLVILAGSALWGFLDYQRIVADVAIQADHRMTRLTAVRIRDELAVFPSALVNLARSAAIIGQDPELQSQALRQAPPIREGLFDAGIVLLNNFGVVTAVEPARPELLQQDWSNRFFFRELLNSSPSSVVFSNAVSDGPAGSQVIVVSVPVIDGEGRFVGALAGMLRLSQSTISPYYATLVKLRVSPDGTAYLIDRSSRILFDSASLRDGEQYENYQLPASGEAGAAEALRTRDATGREILVSHALIPGTPWTLVIEKDWESLMAPTRLHMNLLLGLLGLGAALPLLALILHVRQGKRQVVRGGPIVRESHLAHQIEHALLAEAAPILPGWEIAVHREPAPVLGRVFYDILLGVDGCLTLVIAETSRPSTARHDGAAEALAMVTVRTLLRSAARNLLPPTQALERTNQLLCPDLQPDHFVACLYCRLDPTSGALAVGNADQVQPLKLAGGSAERVGGKGLPLALQLDSAYGEYTSVLAEGDCMILCSSEVLAATNAAGEEFGLARLEQALRAPDATGAQRIAAVTSALREFAGGKWANDRSAILIALERPPGGTSLAQM